jgi:hypothetical protein
MTPEVPDVTGLFAGISALTIGAICIGTLVTLVITVGITFLAIKMIRKAVGPDRSTLESGIPAQARIVNVRQTGMFVNNQPQIAFTLEVHPPSGTPYQVETKAVIPMVNIPQFQPGAQVPVKIHPTDPSKVVLDVYG